MPNLNKVMLMGHIGKDPEIKVSQGNGNKRVSFSLATSKKVKGLDGAMKEQTEWHNIVGWGKSAEIFQSLNISKGTGIYVEGELTYRQWEKDGQKHSITEVFMSNFQLLGGKSTESKPNAYSAKNKAQQEADAIMDDLPF